MGDPEMLTQQLGRPPRGFAEVAVRCPYGRPAVVEQVPYLPTGEPFPTTYYLTCPSAVRRVGRIEADGGVDRYEALVASDPGANASLLAATAEQRRLRRHAETMADGGSSLALGIAGTARPGAIKCLHAHVAFALARPGYALGERMIAESEPLYPTEGCCCD
jgi:hypothetical protein